MKKYAIIVAGGSGTRMKSTLPKQFMEIGGLPVLMHTLRQFHAADSRTQLIVVLPQAHIALWESLTWQYNFEIAVQVTQGGDTRCQSVRNGLALVADDADGVVAIHDAVRPLVLPQIINHAYAVAEQKGNAVVTVALKDSIRKVEGDLSQALDRSQFRLVQTPQTFRVSQIKQAFELTGIDSLTDDAAVAEHAGFCINLIDGDYENIKITTPDDMLIAEAILAKRGRNT